MLHKLECDKINYQTIKSNLTFICDSLFYPILVSHIHTGLFLTVLFNDMVDYFTYNKQTLLKYQKIYFT